VTITINRAEVFVTESGQYL